MDHHLIYSVLAYLGAAVIAVPLFRKLKLGAILGYLIAGAVIGPQGFHVIEHPEEALHFAEFGVVMLLFVIGLELNPEKLWRMRGQISLLGGGQLIVSAVIIALGVFGLFEFSWQQSILIGLTLGLSSTAFAVQLMDEHGIMGQDLGRKGFAILLLQDLAVIPVLLLVGFWSPAAENAEAVIWWYGPLAIVSVLFVGRYALNPVLKIVAQSGSREVLTAAALLIVLGNAVLMQSVGLSMGMGAFLAGIILANSNYRHQLEADIEPFKGLLLGLFFIAVGMTLDLQLLVNHPVIVFALALGLMAVKVGVIAALLGGFGTNIKDGLILGLMLSQGGEFAFVVMAKAVGANLFEPTTGNFVVLVVGISMALTSPLVMLFKRLQKPVQSATVEFDSHSGEEPEVVIAGFGRFGQIVGRILAANGLKFTALDKDANHVEFVKRFGSKIFYGDAKRADLLDAAGINHARVIVVAVDEIDESMVIVKYIRHQYPELKIVARAHNRAHAYKLIDLGVHEVIRETFESSLLAAKNTLMSIGFTEGQALGKVDVFRKHDESQVHSAAKDKDDTDKLIVRSKESREELERLFKSDGSIE